MSTKEPGAPRTQPRWYYTRHRSSEVVAACTPSPFGGMHQHISHRKAILRPRYTGCGLPNAECLYHTSSGLRNGRTPIVPHDEIHIPTKQMTSFQSPMPNGARFRL